MRVKGISIVLFLALMLVLASIAIGTSGCGGFSSSTPVSIVTSQQSTGIWVTGEGKVSVVPDIATLNLGVESQAATVAVAQSQAATAMDTVIKELKSGGVADKDIKTQYFNVQQLTRWDNDKQEQIVIGYQVSNMVTAKIRKVDNTGAIIDAVTRAGGDYTRINSISFTVDDPTAYHKDVRAKAMADAETKAKQLADLGGVKLGKPNYINESGGYIPIIRTPYPEAAPVPSPAPVTPISPGETEITLTVQVVYGIM